MDRRITSTLAALCIASTLAVAGCSATSTPANAPKPTSVEPTASAGDASGLRLANGLYDQADGTVIALGTLEWKDLEGGFWAITGAPESAGGSADTVIAVIANVTKDDPVWSALAGKTVTVTGKRVEGASVRMAGPEIDATSVSEISDTGGAAQ